MEGRDIGSRGRGSRLLRGLYRLYDEGAFCCFFLAGSALVHFLYRIRCEDGPSLRGDRPVILASNHTSYLDPVILQTAVPRRITYLMNEVYYRIRVLNWFFRRMGCIPVRVSGSQLAAIRAGIEALRTRGVIAIFPEGGRSPDGRLRKGFPGVATLARRTGALVIPVAISGAFEALPRGARMIRPARLRVRFGRALDFSALSRSSNLELTRTIMDSIRAPHPND